MLFGWISGRFGGSWARSFWSGTVGLRASYVMNVASVGCAIMWSVTIPIGETVGMQDSIGRNKYGRKWLMVFMTDMCMGSIRETN